MSKLTRLSVLDQSIAVAGRPQDQSIRNTVSLAQHCEALGYERFWVSEHHNHPTIVGTAPEIVIAAIAATTERIRIGSAGIMLPHYAPLKVAEQFRVLDALAPGRIDLGVGRAPGSDGRTAQLLNPDRSASHAPRQCRASAVTQQGSPGTKARPNKGLTRKSARSKAAASFARTNTARSRNGTATAPRCSTSARVVISSRRPLSWKR